FGFVLIHNHPSGDPSPSTADQAFTRQLKQGSELLGLRFVDHIIIGRPAPAREAYYSFREYGLL
ncbi:MAG: JAB domain-containing protein, partial [Verrucomicrobiales bacterium]